MAELTGVMVGHYFLLECLSRQGMVETYLARPTTSGGYDVRLRLFRPPFPDPGAFQEHFSSEVRKLWRSEHANIQPLIEYGEGDDVLYTATREDGTPTLADLLARQRERTLPLPVVATLTSQICEALQYAHERGIVHGNLQPSSILISPDGQVRLTDFSCKRAYHEGEAALAQVEEGNAAYIAPEQAVGMLAPASDIYALGVLLFQLLGGELPYDGQSAGEIAMGHASEPLPSLRALRPQLGQSLEMVVHGAMAKTVQARFRSAGELATAFVQALTTDRAPAIASTGRIAVNARRTGFSWAQALSLLAILLLIAGLSSTLSLFSFSSLPFALGPGLPGRILHAPGSFPGLLPQLPAQQPPSPTPSTGGVSAGPAVPVGVHPSPGVLPLPPTATPVSPLACAPGSLSIDGSFYLAPLLHQIGRDYQLFCPGLSITLAGHGCRTGLKALENGRIDLADSDLSVSTTVQLSDYPVAALLAAVIVSPDIPISGLSHQQLQAIYQGHVTNWLQLGGPNQAITVLLHPASDPLKAIFQAFVLNGSAEHVAGSKLSKGMSAAAIAQATASTPGAITYVPLAAVRAANIHVLAIDQALPSTHNVLRGTYPFWNVAHLYTRPGATEQARAYIQFLQAGPEANRLAQAGALPLALLPLPVLTSHLPGPLIAVS
jgi:ABC-type phosphate transport system substrate-binding protein/serine/threonine protein kinase